MKQLDNYSSNLANYVLQIYQKSVTSGMTSTIQWEVEGWKEAEEARKQKLKER